MRSHSTAVTVSSATAETAAGVRLGTWLGSVWPTRRTRIACVLLLADVCSRHSTTSTVTVPAVPLMSDAFGGHLAHSTAVTTVSFDTPIRRAISVMRAPVSDGTGTMSVQLVLCVADSVWRAAGHLAWVCCACPRRTRAACGCVLLLLLAVPSLDCHQSQLRQCRKQRLCRQWNESTASSNSSI